MRLLGYSLFMVFLVGLFSCAHLKSTQSSSTKEKQIHFDGAGADSTEYDVIVMDPGFESWFIKNRKQAWYHTKESLEVKNWQYVNAWNQKVISGDFQMRNKNNPFTETIDYRRGIDYGLDVNYKLFYYFKFIETTWGKF